MWIVSGVGSAFRFCDFSSFFISGENTADISPVSAAQDHGWCNIHPPVRKSSVEHVYLLSFSAASDIASAAASRLLPRCDACTPVLPVHLDSRLPVVYIDMTFATIPVTTRAIVRITTKTTLVSTSGHPASLWAAWIIMTIVRFASGSSATVCYTTLIGTV